MTSFTSTPDYGDTYSMGETIQITVTLDNEVDASTSAYVAIDVGGPKRHRGRLTLSTGAANGDEVTLDYAVESNPARDPAGNVAQPLTSWAVTNHTVAPRPVAESRRATRHQRSRPSLRSQDSGGSGPSVF